MIVENKRKAYESDLTDSQWEIIEPLMWKLGNKSKKALYRYPSIEAGFADEGYRGTFKNTFEIFIILELIFQNR